MSKNNSDFFREKKEWSEIKDQLLGCYLTPYFSKILVTYKPVFYVDAFAGKGRFDDGKPGSPIIALEKIDSAIKTSRNLSPIIESCFIECRYAKDLIENINGYPNAKVIAGKYEDCIETELLNRTNQNVFIYLDPYGIKSLKYSLIRDIAKRDFNSVELLFNFNSFGFIREACNSMSINCDIEDKDVLKGPEDDSFGANHSPVSDLNEVAGGEYWQEIVGEMQDRKIEGYQAEKMLSNQYCEMMGKQFKFVLNMPIRMKRKQRPKYRMIYATNHPKGCVLMNNNMVKRWEALQEIQTCGQISIFAEDAENQIIDLQKMNEELMSFGMNIEGYIDTFIALFVCQYGIKYSSGDITRELDKLCSSKKFEVKRDPAITDTGKPSKFWSSTKGQSVKVRFVNEKN